MTVLPESFQCSLYSSSSQTITFHNYSFYLLKSLFWKCTHINKSRANNIMNPPIVVFFFFNYFCYMYHELQWDTDCYLFLFHPGLAQCLAHYKHSTKFLFWMRRTVKVGFEDNYGTTEKSETRKGEFWQQLVTYSSVYSLPGSGLSIWFQR